MTKQATAMTEGNIWKQLLLFSIPLILGNLLQQLYNTADSIIVGNFIGKEALAAVGSSGSLINLLIGFFIGTSTGAGVVLAQQYGAGKKENVQKVVHTTLALAGIAGIGLTVLGILATPVLLQWMGTPEEVFKESVLYLKIYFGGALFNVVYNMAAGILNAVGNSKRSLLYLAIASVTNIVLDLFLVVVLHMGVEGVAIATDISQIVSSVCILVFLIRSDDMYQVKIQKIRVDAQMAKKIIQIGIPTGIQNMVISFSNVLIQSSVNAFGAAAMAGFAAYVKIDGFNILPVMSISMAATTFVGQNIGAGKMERVKSGMKVTVIMGVVYSAATGILLYVFGTPIISVFTQDAEVVQYGLLALSYFCPFYFLLAIMHGLAGAIRGTGKTIPPMLIILMSLCIYRVLWIQFIAKPIGDIHWVFVSYPISWLIGMILMVMYTWKGKWKPDFPIME